METELVHKKNIFTIALTIVALGGIVLSSFFFVQYQNAQNIINNSPAIQGQLEAKELVQKISQIMLLPTNEVPTVATVSDVKKLASQSFFKNAKNGDKMLIYTKSQLAILYDTSTNKIIAVSPINLGQTQAQIRIALYNGTTTVGFTNTVEEQLKANISNVYISEKTNAKNMYKKTLVVDLTGSQQQLAYSIAALLGGQVASLPIGEAVPSNSDLLIIVGK